MTEIDNSKLFFSISCTCIDCSSVFFNTKLLNAWINCSTYCGNGTEREQLRRLLFPGRLRQQIALCIVRGMQLVLGFQFALQVSIISISNCFRSVMEAVCAVHWVNIYRRSLKAHCESLIVLTELSSGLMRSDKHRKRIYLRNFLVECPINCSAFTN